MSITCRPVYDRVCRRGILITQWWGIYAAGVLTALTRRYPSKVMHDLLVGDPRNSRDPMKYEGRDWMQS
jgi:hypothetical protein